MGRFGLYAKISLLVLALAAVVFVIRSLNKDKVQDAFEALGIPDAPATASAAGPKVVERTLCRTRVHAIRFPNGDTVIEKKKGLDLQWTAESAENAGTPRQLNYLEVEKWFSRHCKFKAAVAPPLENLEPSNEPVKYVLIEFIDKSTWEIYREGDAFLSASNPKDRFTSTDFAEGFVELRSIAGFAVDSKSH